jgi:hypothetical protein
MSRTSKRVRHSSVRAEEAAAAAAEKQSPITHDSNIGRKMADLFIFGKFLHRFFKYSSEFWVLNFFQIMDGIFQQLMQRHVMLKNIRCQLGRSR